MQNEPIIAHMALYRYYVHKHGKSTKKFLDQKQTHVGVEPLKSNQGRDDTFTPSLHVVLFCQICLAFVSSVHRRVVESSGVGSAGNVVHLVHEE